MSALLVQGAAALAVVGALLHAHRRLQRLRGGAAAAPLVEVRARHPLGRETGVAVVSWNGREILVGYGAAGVTALVVPDARAAEVLP